MGRTSLVLFLLVFAVLAAAKEYVLEDLIAEESNTDNRRVIHNVGDDEDHTRGKKVVRQSRVEDTIRTVQEPITGPGFKQEPNQSEAVKDKGGGKKEETQDDEDKKTLSQQVADGKYGLIQTELFSKRPERPGIISYEVNPEVPKDNVNNLGGLRQEEIWLAENHLLVLAGGNFKDKSLDQSIWPPIDNYIAPPRPVKIPANPKVPPPFPVQLKPGGPVEFIKNENGTGGPPPFFPFPPPNNSFPYPPQINGPGNFTLGNGPYLPPPFPFFPSPNGSLPFPPPGFLPPIPPGAAFLPPPGNLTETFDEDDPSLYYPPPYSFYYPKDNSSSVPPGPLVPGIVLPPPPDFFAPFKNTTASKPRRPTTRPSKKPTTRKPTKHKNVQIITSTEDSYGGVKIRPSIGNINIVTTPPPHLVYTTHTPPVTTQVYTRRPTVHTTTDNSLNEVTPPTIVHALPPNAVVKGWVPIPAPHPYYITGARKPFRKVTTTLPPDYNSVTPPENQVYGFKPSDYDLSITNWIYPNKTKTYTQDQQFYKVNTESPKHDFYYDDIYSEKGQFYSSTESPLQYDDQTRLKSLFYPTNAPPASTISPAHLYRSHLDSRGKALKTYYFYEEPHISQGKLTDTDSLPPYPPALPQPKFRQSNAHTITEESYENSAAKPSLQGQFKPSPLDYFYPQEEYINVPRVNTPSPVHYYYPERSKGYSGYSYSGIAGTTARPETSTKPPVYEYSFAIPGYGSAVPGKVGNGQEEQYAYQTTPRPYQEPLFTTAAPTTTPASVYNTNNQYYTTKRPHTTPRPTVQTDNPYYAFFTHQDSDLIDDITKKYFTTFGQKLNKGEAVTSPLPPIDDVSSKDVFPHTSPRPQYYETDKPRTKYIQNSGSIPGNIYYSTAAPPIQSYPQRVPYPTPIYSQFYDQRPYSSLISTQKPIPLGSDVLVNYKEPLPPINPDAEFIDPSTPGLAKPDQSFISYRLPGNGGGHFFFLTPQVAQQSQQYSDYVFSADRDQSAPYYKRNARRPQTQRRRPSPPNTRTK
ncbi:uncharacterized protein LOC128986292 [Macrosteles quadrilineatus]|uniref:uncharacterized protein LOC128986292 n=1 Tax=Macrosteles quadrilineatus TaxID=74068 RepID=UPI0023E30219|nr:uncharacterized protein LOC128986292 [Macrosteles quadrilineatus]